ncbi:putative acetyl-CoA hydrolase (Acetyl-CoA hydrolase/transferase family protein) [Desulfamplus magnetovallimortis]|uniref:Putative acetyl-CoA hydrolase (Acetyl-CoA hydrolase/transferase family protein) n=1 Tax=Desulfamplus magnetovallimortis TaxID=1246637 RepID=A0A1W1HA41_9BACT|nr:acetyl-CoA hydrolase/transferase C-terminal domain-containing protein [Desulfamplus magnetovallimortis]SLM29275.1 putative acetyl-CoA hydrolase (Acetyl-CoA hydrolase/transferase family protein) [Desulfamplus magnetovallimortis]
MEKKAPEYYSDVEKCIDDLIANVGKKIVMAAPLALAKPCHLINALYLRAKQDPTIQFTLITAVSLEKPTWSSELERRFMQPLVERIWEDFPDFQYVLDMRKNKTPPNFTLVEFFNKAAGWMGNSHAAQNYLGSNYTHAIRDAFINGCNVICQLVAQKEIDGKLMYSMGSNPDTHYDGGHFLRELRAREGKKNAIIAQVHPDMPFMYGKAVVEPGFYDMVIDSPDYHFKLFGAPKEPVNSVDWMIGMHASTLVKDGGTIQVGIGSLGDAIVAGIEMRHKHNDTYRQFMQDSDIYSKFGELIDSVGGIGEFEEGILGSSEMLVDSLIELFKADILKRKVYEDIRLQKVINANGFTENQVEEIFRALLKEKLVHTRIKKSEFDLFQKFGIFKQDMTYENGSALLDGKTYSLDMSDADNLEAVVASCLGDTLKNGIALYASFFVGPQSFYKDLREMDEERLKLIDMRSVDYVNHLYGDEELKRLQRKHGRFINAGLMATLAGAVVADGLEDNRIISGPGGQYNFVSMAHELADGRAVTMIRSSRGEGEHSVSNIVWQYAHTTIPRHLRDIVVTEYGIADVRGRPDREVMKRLICIADSRFQESLLAKAKKAGKIPAEWQIPDQFRNNLPETLESKLGPYRLQGYFQPFPFGTDLTDEEIVLGKALKGLKEIASKSKFAIMPGLISKSISSIPEKAMPYLQRMDLDKPSSMQERLMQKMVIFALSQSGQI